jgi:hypothetical protein
MHEPHTGEHSQTPPLTSSGATGRRNTLSDGSDAVQRADAILNDIGTRLGQWAARLQHETARLTARTREEVEDIWAEAQSLRHHEGATLPALSSDSHESAHELVASVAPSRDRAHRARGSRAQHAAHEGDQETHAESAPQ